MVASAPSKSATSKRRKNKVSRIFSRKSAENVVSRNSAGKKIWLAGSQPKNCVSRSLAMKKFGSGV